MDSSAIESRASAPARDLRRVTSIPIIGIRSRGRARSSAARRMACTFAGDPIVLVRTESGKVFALEDRCAHRQVPLHAGVVDGESIRCCYHGWTYDCTGRCIDVPYLGRERLPNGVRAYPCREEAGLVFVFHRRPGARRNARSFPTLAPLTDKAYKTRRFGREVKCHYSFMHENLMDMNHQFLHRRQMGQMRARSLGQPARRRLGRSRLHVRARGRQAADRRGARVRCRAGATADDDHKDVMTIRTGYPYQTLRSAPRTTRW